MGETLQNIRRQIRENSWDKPTAGHAEGYVQANLVILRNELAYDFLLFCMRNEQACPLLDVTDAGSPVPKLSAPECDLRTDVPKYRVYRNGVLEEERKDIKDLWEEDFTAFLLGCSFTFETALMNHGIPCRHIEEEVNVPMYKTNIPLNPAGAFSGTMVVSMRPLAAKDIGKAVQITARSPKSHGAPVHIGNPAEIGITEIDSPDYGDAVSIRDGEVPVFWACGVTPQNAAAASKPELMISHSPGHMFLTDLKNTDLMI
ncbi:putative hydro-lyase [Metabacillus sp. GX 13764]|uniref:putative hydro-lyase n=1 Tax=Metabacillus kandeliae TaxID=2900151 RepID=UPI001E58D854|nr:putative hydro-lyase [Metabacillus kandeliae]MCD7032770.1 putative hydro-lyase [Metabacillus kandeliae]